jgi:hypothetical protein
MRTISRHVERAMVRPSPARRVTRPSIPADRPQSRAPSLTDADDQRGGGIRRHPHGQRDAWKTTKRDEGQNEGENEYGNERIKRMGGDEWRMGVDRFEVPVEFSSRRLIF